jgi:streptogramin lyase
VNIRIGMIHTPKELEVELEDASSEQVVDDIRKAVSDDTGMLWLTDRKGRRVGVVTAKVAWVEVGPEVEGRRVGFSAL